MLSPFMNYDMIRFVNKHKKLQPVLLHGDNIFVHTNLS
jgi:hypothetical protein